MALSDALWKGTRVSDLELAVIDEAAHRLNMQRWDLFVILDTEFETIAADGAHRLLNSV